MKIVTLSEAESRLAELVDCGELVTITRNGRPVATIAPHPQSPRAVAARIRALAATSGLTLSNEEIVAYTRSGRR